jgi:hypothetical protein
MAITRSVARSIARQEAEQRGHAAALVAAAREAAPYAGAVPSNYDAATLWLAERGFAGRTKVLASGLRLSQGWFNDFEVADYNVKVVILPDRRVRVILKRAGMGYITSQSTKFVAKATRELLLEAGFAVEEDWFLSL